MSGIVVGLDGSPHSEQVLEWASREAALRRVPLKVIRVHQPVVGWNDTLDLIEDQATSERVRKAALAQTDCVLDRLGARAPAEVIVDARSGSPAEELLRAAVDADLVVIGSHGAGGFSRLVMGSVSAEVCQRAQCPVVVIPAPRQ